MADYDHAATAAGLDTARRVAWARYYAVVEQAEQDRAALLRHSLHLQRHLARLALAVTRSETLRAIEPEGEVIVEARRVLAALRARARGRAILDALEAEERRRSA